MKLRILLTLFFPVLGVPAGAWGETFDDLAARAAAARDANDLPRAIEIYQQALRLNAQWREGWWFLGALLYDADRYALARDALARCVDLQPDMAPAWGLLGLSEFKTQDYDHALEHIQRSLADTHMEPQMVRVLRYHEAVLLAHSGQFDKAIAKYAWFAGDATPAASLLAAIGIAALREPLLPDDIPADRRDLFEAAGRAFWSVMGHDEAQAANALQQLLNRFPASPGVHSLIGSYLLVAPPGEAVAEFRRELDSEPGNPAAATMLACTLLNHADAAAALPYAAKAAQEAPRLSMAQYAFGLSLVETGGVATGTEHLEQAVQLDPDNIDGHIALATAYSKAGRTVDARAERSRTVELSRGVASHAPR
ncbi:MAG: tetratricopeptide repeat protein [Bryobacteraceae bacterium]|jgi:tetratricopeptide (TPR) repeat protein